MSAAALVLSYARSESGAVTVDWVVLTAAVVGLGLAVTNTVSTGLESLSSEIEAQLLRDQISVGFNE